MCVDGVRTIVQGMFLKNGNFDKKEKKLDVSGLLVRATTG